MDVQEQLDRAIRAGGVTADPQEVLLRGRRAVRRRMISVAAAGAAAVAVVAVGLQAVGLGKNEVPPAERRIDPDAVATCPARGADPLFAPWIESEGVEKVCVLPGTDVLTASGFDGPRGPALALTLQRDQDVQLFVAYWPDKNPATAWISSGSPDALSRSRLTDPERMGPNEMMGAEEDLLRDLNTSRDATAHPECPPAFTGKATHDTIRYLASGQVCVNPAFTGVEVVLAPEQNPRGAFMLRLVDARGGQKVPTCSGNPVVAVPWRQHPRTAP